jgi:hypothetical protein
LSIQGYADLLSIDIFCMDMLDPKYKANAEVHDQDIGKDGDYSSKLVWRRYIMESCSSWQILQRKTSKNKGAYRKELAQSDDYILAAALNHILNIKAKGARNPAVIIGKHRRDRSAIFRRLKERSKEGGKEGVEKELQRFNIITREGRFFVAFLRGGAQ